MTKTIIIDGVAYSATVINTTTTGQTEAKAPAPAVAVRKANGHTPLYRVRYTSAAGNEAVYGVFWEGPSREDASKPRLGLRPLLKSGLRMVKPNRYCASSKGFFVDADRCQRIG